MSCKRRKRPPMMDVSFGIEPADDERVQRLLAVLEERQPALKLYLSDAYRACVLVGLEQLERENGLSAGTGAPVPAPPDRSMK